LERHNQGILKKNKEGEKGQGRERRDKEEGGGRREEGGGRREEGGGRRKEGGRRKVEEEGRKEETNREDTKKGGRGAKKEEKKNSGFRTIICWLPISTTGFLKKLCLAVATIVYSCVD
jgi:ATP-dependent RNA helicase DHX57